VHKPKLTSIADSWLLVWKMYECDWLPHCLFILCYADFTTPQHVRSECYITPCNLNQYPALEVTLCSQLPNSRQPFLTLPLSWCYLQWNQCYGRKCIPLYLPLHWELHLSLPTILDEGVSWKDIYFLSFTSSFLWNSTLVGHRMGDQKFIISSSYVLWKALSAIGPGCICSC
jgi:hypothetical protein